MTEETRETMWPPAMFTEQAQEAGEQMMNSQQEMMKRFLSAGSRSGFDGLSSLGAMSMGTAMFKTRVQSGGRISIPDAEREALDIGEGDIVQTIVIPIKRTHSDSE